MLKYLKYDSDIFCKRTVFKIGAFIVNRKQEYELDKNKRICLIGLRMDDSDEGINTPPRYFVFVELAIQRRLNKRKTSPYTIQNLLTEAKLILADEENSVTDATLNRLSFLKANYGELLSSSVYSAMKQ
eukprot:snap_masked-scaffold_2-processed-gene-9.16-mRNA-1 protein AED:1.00 eAED:1.00 QI:0/0/0/0/1/1/2/0/128